MKIKIILIFMIILFTGCEVKDITIKDVDIFIEDALKSQRLSVNKSFKGYKFALPRGFTITDKKENNYILLSNKDSYYLYIDTVSYFYKSSFQPIKEENLFLYKEIEYKKNKGYIKIEKTKVDEYLVKMVYNYSKIEVKTNEKNLKHVVQNSIEILLSVEYNDITLKSLIGEDVLDYKEEIFKLFESKRETGTFLDYIEEYERNDEKETYKDDDFIE